MRERVCMCVCVGREREGRCESWRGRQRQGGVFEEEDKWLFDTQTLCTFPSALMFI